MSTLKKVTKSVATAALIAQASITTAFAQVNTDEFLPDDPTSKGNLIDFIRDGINLAIGLAGLVAVGFLVYSGVQYIVAAGDEGKVEKATKGITYSVVGLIISFISVLIVNFVLERVIGSV